MKFLASLALLGVVTLALNSWLKLFENRDMGFLIWFAVIFAFGFAHDLIKARSRNLTLLEYWRLPR